MKIDGRNVDEWPNVLVSQEELAAVLVAIPYQPSFEAYKRSAQEAIVRLFAMRARVDDIDQNFYLDTIAVSAWRVRSAEDGHERPV